MTRTTGSFPLATEALDHFSGGQDPSTATGPRGAAAAIRWHCVFLTATPAKTAATCSSAISFCQLFQLHQPLLCYSQPSSVAQCWDLSDSLCVTAVVMNNGYLKCPALFHCLTTRVNAADEAVRRVAQALAVCRCVGKFAGLIPHLSRGIHPALACFADMCAMGQWLHAAASLKSAGGAGEMLTMSILWHLLPKPVPWTLE